MAMSRFIETKAHQGYRGCAAYDWRGVELKNPNDKPMKLVIRITLVGSSPRVWREIAVPGSIRLTSLAHVIILAMGWEENHLSLFKKWRKEYHVYMEGADMYDYPIADANDYALCDLLENGEQMTFVYDFGDNWRHTIKVMDVVSYEKDEKYIRLIDGKNACPPNDVGGVHGYKEMLRILKEEPDSEEAEEYYNWLGSKWDATYFPAIDTAIALNELNYK